MVTDPVIGIPTTVAQQWLPTFAKEKKTTSPNSNESGGSEKPAPLHNCRTALFVGHVCKGKGVNLTCDQSYPFADLHNKCAVSAVVQLSA